MGPSRRDEDEKFKLTLRREIIGFKHTGIQRGMFLVLAGCGDYDTCYRGFRREQVVPLVIELQEPEFPVPSMLPHHVMRRGSETRGCHVQRCEVEQNGVGMVSEGTGGSGASVLIFAG
jgi:hypothetical protein